MLAGLHLTMSPSRPFTCRPFHIELANAGGITSGPNRVHACWEEISSTVVASNGRPNAGRDYITRTVDVPVQLWSAFLGKSLAKAGREYIGTAGFKHPLLVCFKRALQEALVHTCRQS